MKRKNINNLMNWLIITIALFLLLACGYNKNFSTRSSSISSSDSTVYIDTTFTIQFEADIREISGFGCHVVYDSNQIKYVSSQKNRFFDHENIVLQNGIQGRLIIGFNQLDCQNSIRDTTIVVFLITFRVKINADEGISPIRFESAYAKLCDLDVTSQWHGINLLIQEINKFIMRMKLR